MQLIKFLFFLLFPLLCSGLSLKNYFERGLPGDFVIISQNQMYSALIIQDISEEQLVLQEINIAQNQTKENMDWTHWLNNKAPGHSSWTLYEIDLKNDQLVECFSLKKKAWINFQDSDLILVKFLSLLMHENKNLWKPFQELDTYQINWPKDDTVFSKKTLNIFMSDKSVFPYWIQIDQDKSLLFRAAAFGHLHRLQKYLIPRRPLQFDLPMLLAKDGLRIKVKAPRYYKDFSLYALDVSEQQELISFSYHIVQRDEHTLIIDIPYSQLNQQLQKQHKYLWIMTPIGYKDQAAEMQSPFMWNPKIITKQ